MRLTSLVVLSSAAALTSVVVTRRRRASRVMDALEPPSVVTRPLNAIRRAVRRAGCAVRRMSRAVQVLTCVALVQVPVVAALLWDLGPAESTGGQCSLALAYGLITAAIAALGIASALAAIFFNIPALIAAIGLVLTVSFVLIPQIRAAIESYDRCKGPSKSCRLDLSVNTLGQAAMLTAVAAWIVALALQILAVFHFGTVFLAWLGALELGTSEVLKWGGVVSNIAAVGVLIGLLTMVAVYEACRNRESDPGPIPEGIG
jgi:hypothetical protein